MDKEFLLRAKRGDKEAQLQLIDKYKPLVTKYSLKYNLKGFDREDLVQEGNVSILKAISRFNIDKDINFFDAYAINAIRNNYKDLLQRKINANSESSLNIINEDGSEIIDIISDTIDIENDIMVKTDLEALRKAFQLLTKDELELIEAVYFKEEGTLNKYCQSKNISFYQGKKLLNKIIEKIKLVVA